MFRKAPAWAVSLVFHVICFGAFVFVPVAVHSRQTEMALESLFSDDARTPDDFTKDLDTQSVQAENLNFQGGGVIVTGSAGGGGGGGGGGTGGGGGGGGGGGMAKIDESGSFSDPDVGVGAGDVDIPGGGTIGKDLGSGKIAGEIGAIVEGNGAALDRISQELMRLMRDQKVCVVWLFDESESMKEDQKDLKTRVHRVYEELKLADTSTKEDVLVNAIVSFGAQVHYQTPRGKVSDNIPELIKAIDKIPNDPTGKENTFAAVAEVVNEYRGLANASHRKLVVILVSDESGDDGEAQVENALQACLKARASVYILGRESVFGYPIAYVEWIEPVEKTYHRLPIRRGPETPYAELLQFDGFVARTDSSMSGFGPYEQCKLARDTGGIFFMLPGEQKNLFSYTAGKDKAMDLRPYAPDLGTRMEYQAKRNASPFRKAVWDVILLLSPLAPGNTKVEVHPRAFSLAPGKYEGDVQAMLNQCAYTFNLMTEAQARLEAVGPLRAKEESRRWRANYDLILGQLRAYRVRMFQYAIGLEHFGTQLPKMKHDPKCNVWGVAHGAADLLKPTESQAKRFKITFEDIVKARNEAVQTFDKVIAEHPNTPWAQKAAWEKTRGFGASYGEWFVGVPPPRPPGSPKPQPVPNL